MDLWFVEGGEEGYVCWHRFYVAVVETSTCRSSIQTSYFCDQCLRFSRKQINTFVSAWRRRCWWWREGATLLFAFWLPVFSSFLLSSSSLQNARLQELVVIPANLGLQRACCVLLFSCVNWGKLGSMAWGSCEHHTLKSPCVQYALSHCYCYKCWNSCQWQFTIFPKVESRKGREWAIFKMGGKRGESF